MMGLVMRTFIFNLPFKRLIRSPDKYRNNFFSQPARDVDRIMLACLVTPHNWYAIQLNNHEFLPPGWLQLFPRLVILFTNPQLWECIKVLKISKRKIKIDSKKDEIIAELPAGISSLQIDSANAIKRYANKGYWLLQYARFSPGCVVQLYHLKGMQNLPAQNYLIKRRESDLARCIITIIALITNKLPKIFLFFVMQAKKTIYI